MKRSLFVVFSVLLVLALSLGASAQGVVTMMGVWGGQELEAFQEVMEAFTAKTGITVQFEGTRDLPTLLQTRIAAGNPPDVAAIPGPGAMKEYVEQGALVDLNGVLDVDTLTNDVNDAWIELGTYKDGLYALMFSADIKSLVWYRPDEFAAKGYAIPTTWDEMEALMEQMVANGDTPWAIGLESGAASGWPATDWIEDIMLRTAGPDVYDQWVNHEIPWTDPRVQEAFEIFGKITTNSDYVYGGPITVLATNFGDSVAELFTDPPRAMMHRQASFITSFIRDANPDVEIGKDVSFFGFPMINPEHGNPMLGAGSMIAQFNDNPEAAAFMNFLAGPEAQEIWVNRLGKLGTNNKINPEVYPDDLTREMAELLNQADVFRFDGSDSMPAAVGSGAFWEGTLMYVGGEDLAGVLEFIENVAVDSY
ncbi:MAG: extracellular solute-binding protein [Bacillota bacterium]|nr:extracellular solute-binding protein [Bacillota bacterium]HHT90729.1 extracellular solute-binding protein [Bacillota bacterium]